MSVSPAAPELCRPTRAAKDGEPGVMPIPKTAQAVSEIRQRK